jgi:uncharacterized membrane protein SirB2
MITYATIRTLHITCAGITIALFALRGGLQLAGKPWRQHLWLRILPHVNDTILLTAAITLAVMSGSYPFAQSWLTAKVLALLAYIVLGKLALAPALATPARGAAFAGALCAVGYIVSAAVTRSATPGLF